MRSLPRWNKRRQPADGIPPHATGTPRRAPSWPGETVVNEHPFWQPIADEIPQGLPPENRGLLTAYPDAPASAPNGFLAALALAATLRRSGCRILAVSAAFEYEAAVGQNLAILADQAHPAVTA